MRTLSGTIFFIADIAAFEHTSTPEVARPMESPVMAEPVVPSVGHMPSNSTNVGFSVTRPLYMMRSLFIRYRFFSFVIYKSVITFAQGRQKCPRRNCGGCYGIDFSTGVLGDIH